PGCDAPSTVTGVPTGSEAEVHPSVSVLPPVPEQGAAWPMKTSVPSVKTKLAVHCAPSVSVCTPGWIAAVGAGAQVGAAPPPAGERPNVPSATTAPSPTNRNTLRTASPQGRVSN